MYAHIDGEMSNPIKHGPTGNIVQNINQGFPPYSLPAWKFMKIRENMDKRSK
jgi:hypothetical protein